MISDFILCHDNFMVTELIFSNIDLKIIAAYIFYRSFFFFRKQWNITQSTTQTDLKLITFYVEASAEQFNK